MINHADTGPSSRANAGNSKKVRRTMRLRRVKALILICVALFFFAYMIYSGGSTGGFVALVIGLVCGLIGVLYLREGKKDSTGNRRQRRYKTGKEIRIDAKKAAKPVAKAKKK